MMTENTVRLWFPQLVRETMHVEVDQTLSQWAEDNIVLPDTSPEPGPIDLSRTPYLIPILDAIGTPWVEEVDIKAGSQLGKTTIDLITMGWLIKDHPTEALFLYGREQDARTMSQQRMKPIILASPNLATFIDGKTQVTNEQIDMNGCHIYFDTVNSPAALSAKPIEFLSGDETHLWPRDLKGEGSPYELAKKRTSNYQSRKIIMKSTPSDEASLNEDLYRRGTQHVWNIRCPKCKALQAPKFAQIKSDEKDPARLKMLRCAYYECEACGHQITESEKEDALTGGCYVPNNQTVDRPAHMSFWIHGICSPWRTFSGILAEFFECELEPDKAKSAAMLQAFKNTTLGEAFVNRVQVIPSRELFTWIRHSINARGELPADTQMVTAGVDWHGDRKGLFYSIWAWAHGRRGWLVDYGQVPSTEELDAALWRVWPCGGYNYLPVVGVDCGYKRFEVLLYTSRHHPSAMPTRGVDWRKGGIVGRTQMEAHDVRTGRTLKGQWGLELSTNDLKDGLSFMLQRGIGEVPEEENVLLMCGDVGDEFVKTLTSEHKAHDSKGVIRWMPVYDGAPNHWWDTINIAMGIAEFKGLGLLPQKIQGKDQPQQAVQAPAPRLDQGRRYGGLGNSGRYQGARRH